MAKKTGLGKGLDALFAENTLLKNDEEEKKEELKDGEKIKNPATGDFVLVYVGLIVIATVIAVFAKKQVKAKHNK